MRPAVSRAVMAEAILIAVTDTRPPVDPADPRLRALMVRPAKQLAKSYAMALRLIAKRRAGEQHVRP